MNNSGEKKKSESPLLNDLRKKINEKSNPPQSKKKTTLEKPSPKNIPSESELKVKMDAIKSFSENFYFPLPLLKNLNNHRCLALDIDVDKIRYIIAKKSGDLIQVKKWGIQRFPPEITHRFKALQITMEHLKQKLYKNGTEIRVSVFSTDFMIKQEVFPFIKKRQELEKAIFFKFREDLKHFNDEDFSWGYDILEKFEEQGLKKLRVQVVFAPQDTINRYTYIFKHLKLPVEQLIPRPAGLLAAYEKIVELPKSDLLINISYDFTQICYLKKGYLEYIRNLGIGVRNLEFTIKQDDGNILLDGQVEHLNSEIPSGKEESILKKRLLEKLKDLKTKQNPVLHTFFSEILRSIAFIQGGNRRNYIDRILLTGYGIQKESLVPYLKSRLNIPIFVIYPKLAERPIREQLKFGEFFTTLGTLVQKHEGFNLLPSKFKERISYRRLGHWLYFIIFITAFIVGYLSFAQYKLFTKQAVLVYEKEKEYVTLNPFKESYQKLIQQIGNVKKENNNLKSVVEARPPILEMMRLFSNLTPQKIRLNAFVFRQLQSDGKMITQEAKGNLPKYAVTVEGEIKGDFVNGDVELINFINSLDNLKFFKSIHLDHKDRNQEKKIIDFGITMEF